MPEYFGLWPGTVVENIDPERSGRVQVRVPQIYGPAASDKKLSDSDLPWALPCVPFANKESGFIMVPSKGSVVWVGFYAGDAEHPVWLGGWYGKGDKIEEHSEGYAPDPQNFVIKTPLGNKLVMKDTPVSVLLSDGVGQELALNGTALSTEFKSLGQHTTKVVGNCQEDIGGNLTVSIGGAYTLTALLAITMSALAAITISAAAACTILVAGAMQLLGTNIIIGQVASAKKLCNLDMMTLYNTHTHTYTLPAHSAGPGPTSVPNQLGVEDTHTTTNVRCS